MIAVPSSLNYYLFDEKTRSWGASEELWVLRKSFVDKVRGVLDDFLISVFSFCDVNKTDYAVFLEQHCRISVGFDEQFSKYRKLNLHSQHLANKLLKDRALNSDPVTWEYIMRNPIVISFDDEQELMLFKMGFAWTPDSGQL